MQIAQPKWRRLQFGFTTLLTVCVVVASVAWWYGDRSPNRPIAVRMKVVHMGTQEAVSEFQFRYQIFSPHVTKTFGWQKVESKHGTVDFRVPASCQLIVFIRARGYLSETYGDKVFEFSAEDPNFRTVKVDLIRSIDVPLQIVDAQTNRPITGAQVAFEFRFEQSHREMSNNDGRVLLADVSRNGWVLIDHSEYHRETRAIADLDFPDVSSISMKKAPMASGIVRNESGDPIQNADVRISDGMEFIKTRTGADGRFILKLPGSKQAHYRFVVTKLGYIAYEDSLTIADAADVEVRLAKCSVFEAFVRDDSGQPISDFDVIALSQVLGTSGEPLPVVQNGGRFKITYSKDGEYWLAVRARGHATWATKTEFKKNAPALEIELVSAMELTGRLRLPATAKDVSVQFSPILDVATFKSQRNDLSVSSIPQFHALKNFVNETVRPDTDGRYFFERMSPGEYEFIVFGAGVTPILQTIQVHREMRQMPDVSIMGTGKVRGTVYVPRSKQPYRFAQGWLELRGAKAPDIEFVADESGKFEVHDAPSGKVVVTVFHQRQSHTDEFEVVEGKTVDVELFVP